jgi:hypothetical protein
MEVLIWVRITFGRRVKFLIRIMSMFDLGIVATNTKRNPPCGV